MLYPSCVVLLWWHYRLCTDLIHRVRHRNFIFGMNISYVADNMHIKCLLIPTCSFQVAAILVLFFDLLSCPKRQPQRLHFSYTYVSFFTYIHQRNNVTVTFFSEIYKHFVKIHILFTSLKHLNLMCFDILATKTKLCVLS